jgi:hypothetical protein
MKIAVAYILTLTGTERDKDHQTKEFYITL